MARSALVASQSALLICKHRSRQAQCYRLLDILLTIIQVPYINIYNNVYVYGNNLHHIIIWYINNVIEYKFRTAPRITNNLQGRIVLHIATMDGGLNASSMLPLSVCDTLCDFWIQILAWHWWFQSESVPITGKVI